jgi:hypothetical protein
VQQGTQKQSTGQQDGQMNKKESSSDFFFVGADDSEDEDQNLLGGGGMDHWDSCYLSNSTTLIVI